MTENEYTQTVKDLAFDILYNIAGMSDNAYLESRIAEDIELAVDVISNMFKIPIDKVDLDVSDEMSKLDINEILKLKIERKTSTLQ